MKRRGMENRHTHLLIRKFKPLKQFPGMGLWGYRCPACRNWWQGFMTWREAFDRATEIHGVCMQKPPYRHPGWPVR